MNEKSRFQGRSALLLGNKPDHPSKYLQVTSAFSMGTLIPHWVYGPGKDPAHRTKKQNVRIKSLKSPRPYGGGTGTKVLWYRELQTTNTALRKKISQQHASNEMFASWVYPIKTAGGNGKKRPKTCPSETDPDRDHLRSIIILRE